MGRVRRSSNAQPARRFTYLHINFRGHLMDHRNLGSPTPIAILSGPKDSTRDSDSMVHCGNAFVLSPGDDLEEWFPSMLQRFRNPQVLLRYLRIYSKFDLRTMDMRFVAPFANDNRPANAIDSTDEDDTLPWCNDCFKGIGDDDDTLRDDADNATYGQVSFPVDPETLEFVNRMVCTQWPEEGDELVGRNLVLSGCRAMAQCESQFPKL